MGTLVKFENASISLSRDGRRNLSISVCLEPGDLAVLLGLNGSGKTSLLDVIAGVRHVDAGHVRIEPNNKPVAYVVQDSASGLLPWRTILANILLPSRLNNQLNDRSVERAYMLLETFGLAERRDDFPYKLSEGEKEIINLIRAVCTPAETVLLDEPFASLNAVARTKAKNILRDFVAGRTTVLVTHDPVDLEWPFTRFLQILDSSIVEMSIREANEFLGNAASGTAVSR